MILYNYRCGFCSHEYEGFSAVADRDASTCPQCNSTDSKLLMFAPRLDPRMGLDPDFPTAYRKWGTNLAKRTTGKMKDSNNTAYGTDRDYADPNNGQ